MGCAVVSEVAPSILPLTFMLILYPYTFPPLHTLFSFIPTDHEITHQWSGNPPSWDSIYQHQRKLQRLLVKLLTNKFNTKIRSPKSNWSGLMQTISKGSHPGKSSVTFLPMIDMDPTNIYTNIYSTLRFVEAQCKRQHTTPIITFDQPLWWKAQRIVESKPPDSELRSITLRLDDSTQK